MTRLGRVRDRTRPAAAGSRATTASSGVAGRHCTNAAAASATTRAPMPAAAASAVLDHRAGAAGRSCNRGRRRALPDAVEFGEQVARRLPAIVGVLRQAPANHVVERGRQPRLHVGERRWLRRHDRRDEHRIARRLERLAPGQHLVEHGSEGEQIGPGVGVSALELLGRHVLDRAEDHAGRRQARFGSAITEPYPRTPIWRARSRAAWLPTWSS